MPRVTLIVRSMGRPLLTYALASIAHQTHAEIDVVVVDATGGAHPPLPAIDWHPSHSVSLVGTGAQLPRARAANVGLDHVRGDFFGWLDDDDAFEPGHVAALLSAAAALPEAPAVYGETRVLIDGKPAPRRLGQPFNRALMYYGPLFHPSAALFRRRVLDLGCRFDERFEVCEDRDFVAQVVQHGDPLFVPIVTLNYAADLGTSGAGAGANRDTAKLLVHETLLRAKWAGPCALHTERAAAYSRRAIRAYATGDHDRARVEFANCLAAYPDDPSALHGLARLALDTADHARAEMLARKALVFIPDSHEFHLTLANALAAQGRIDEAIGEARTSEHHPALRPAARELLARIAPPASPTSLATGATRPSRLAPCPCGSRRRYRDCCGHVDNTAPIPKTTTAALANPTTDAAGAVIRAAEDAFLCGDAEAALKKLDAIDPDAFGDPRAARSAGKIYLALGEYDRAVSFLARSLCLDVQPVTRRELEAACTWRFRAEARISLRRTLRELMAAASQAGGQRPPADSGGAIHLVATLANVGGSETRALQLFDCLTPHADVRLWSANGEPRPEYVRDRPIALLEPDRGRFPRGGTLVFSGPYFDWGDWIPYSDADRIVACYNVDQPEDLVCRLLGVVDSGSRARIDVTFPSAMFRAMSGLDGTIERGMVDLDRFRPTERGRVVATPIVVGRHSRDNPLKHHPNDPTFFRRIAAAGFRVRLLGGMPLAAPLSRREMLPAVELLKEGSIDAVTFLQEIDCYVYRKHPQWIETGGTVIYEAMAMELPVVAFAGGCGALEVIESGVTGFIVDSEDEALDAISRLAADDELRQRIGRAAREHIAEVMQRQRDAALDYYLAAPKVRV